MSGDKFSQHERLVQQQEAERAARPRILNALELRVTSLDLMARRVVHVKSTGPISETDRWAMECALDRIQAALDILQATVEEK